MNAKQTKVLLRSLRVCDEPYKWADGKTLKEIWSTCHRGDWLLWLSQRMLDKEGWGDIRQLTLAKGKCAELVIHLMKDERSIKAVKGAIDYGNGLIGSKELEVLRRDAADAAAAAYAVVAADAAAAAATYAATAAAAYAADAAYADAAAYAPAYAAAYAYADAYAATYDSAYAAAVAAAARKEILLRCANICREILTIPDED